MTEPTIPHDYVPTMDQVLRFMRLNPNTSRNLLHKTELEGLGIHVNWVGCKKHAQVKKAFEIRTECPVCMSSQTIICGGNAL